MPKYLIQGNYSAEGAKGLLKDGGSKRVRAAKAAAKAIGGRVESMYFAFGGTDVFAIVDAPDNARCSGERDCILFDRCGNGSAWTYDHSATDTCGSG